MVRYSNMKRDKTVTCLDINHKKHKVNVSDLSFRPSVYGVLIEQGKILLSKQWSKGYDFPGGGVVIDETVEQALVREFWEETGLTVKVGRLVECKSSFFVLPFGKRAVNSILLYYTVKKTGGRLTAEHLDEDEKQYTEKAEWLDVSKVKDLVFYNSVESREIIRKAQTGS